MNASHLCQGTSLSALQRRAVRSSTSLLQPIRCFETSETRTSSRQLSSNPQPSSILRRCGPLFCSVVCISNDQPRTGLCLQFPYLLQLSMYLLHIKPVLSDNCAMSAGPQGQPVSNLCRQSGSRQVAVLSLSM